MTDVPKIELSEKRTLNAKFFDDNHAEFHAGHIHYFNKLGVGDGEKQEKELI